jgi:hypothetical protein
MAVLAGKSGISTTARTIHTAVKLLILEICGANIASKQPIARLLAAHG